MTLSTTAIYSNPNTPIRQDLRTSLKKFALRSKTFSTFREIPRDDIMLIKIGPKNGALDTIAEHYEHVKNIEIQ